jgi:hypothetical protein
MWGRRLAQHCSEDPREANSFVEALKPGASSSLPTESLVELQMMLDMFPSYTEKLLKSPMKVILSYALREPFLLAKGDGGNLLSFCRPH